VESRREVGEVLAILNRSNHLFTCAFTVPFVSFQVAKMFVLPPFAFLICAVIALLPCVLFSKHGQHFEAERKAALEELKHHPCSEGAGHVLRQVVNNLWPGKIQWGWYDEWRPFMLAWASNPETPLPRHAKLWFKQLIAKMDKQSVFPEDVALFRSKLHQIESR
jgi:hypothetical protein